MLALLSGEQIHAGLELQLVVEHRKLAVTGLAAEILLGGMSWCMW